MTNLDLPTGPVEPWAAEIACKLVAVEDKDCVWTPEDFIADFAPAAMIVLARLIQKYVPEPISPELQAAREAKKAWSVNTRSLEEGFLDAIERFKELEGRDNG